MTEPDMFRARKLSMYAFGELLRVFVMSLVVITAIFVILVIVGQAVKHALTLTQIVRLAPMFVPVTLPYTIPATALFAVSVVYGRLGGDNEILAVKASGITPMVVVWPAWLLAAVMGVGCFFLLGDLIPNVSRRLYAMGPEEAAQFIYSQLRVDKHLAPKASPYSIQVRRVEGTRLIEPTFMKLAADPASPPELVVWAKEAVLRVDAEQNKIHVDMVDGEVSEGGNERRARFKSRTFDVSLPQMSGLPSKPKDLTRAELAESIGRLESMLETEPRAVVAEVSMAMAQCRWMELPLGKLAHAIAFTRQSRKRILTAQAEQAYRWAISASPLAFAILGVPVAILFQRRDFMSAFGACFLPIIGIYYPLLISAKRLSADGQVSPELSLWLGNVLLVILSIPFYRRVLLR